MLHCLDRIYLYVGWRVALFARFGMRDGLHVWKAALLLVSLEFISIFSILIFIETVFSVSVIPNNKFLAVAPWTLLLTVFNIYVFVQRWDVYEAEFKKIPLYKLVCFDLLIILWIVVTIFFFVQALDLLSARV